MAGIAGVGSADLPTKLPGAKTPITWGMEAGYGALVAISARGLDDLGTYELGKYDEALKVSLVKAADTRLKDD